jgi:hypothetical protein
MRNPFRRGSEPSTGRSSLLDSRGRGSGAYTVEIPDVGAGHYVIDPSDPCSIHSRRLEAWCDVRDFDTARDELHWHCMILSQLGIGAEQIREMATQLVGSRQKKLAAEREIVLEAEMAKAEGNSNSAPARAQGEREERQQAEEREQELRKESEVESDKLDRLRKRFDALPRRERVPINFTLVLSVSISFTIFDVGVLGNAFELIPGDWYWKIVLTVGVALAPLSTAIGIAQWLSAAKLPIREGVKATRLALVAGALCIIGIGLIVLFRAAATGDPPLPWNAYVFLAFIQSALAMAETMIYTVYFDSKVGAALLKRIEVAEEDLAAIDSRAVAEHRRATTAQTRIGEIEREAEKAKSQLGRTEPELEKIRTSFDGEAGMLMGIVESAILEGVVAARRAEERKQREAEEPDGEEEELRPWLVGAMTAVAAMSLFIVILVAAGPLSI